MKEEIKKYLAANMFDGDGEAGEVTMKVSRMLDEVGELMEQFILELPKPAEPAKRPLAMLPNGVVLNVDKILFIVRVELGKFVVIYENTSGNGPALGTAEMEVLEQYGIIQRLVPPEAANDAPRIEAAK